MAITDPIDVQPTVVPIVLDFPVPLTDEFIARLGACNPQYRFETDAYGKLVMTPGNRLSRIGRRGRTRAPGRQLERHR